MSLTHDINPTITFDRQTLCFASVKKPEVEFMNLEKKEHVESQLVLKHKRYISDPLSASSPSWKAFISGQ